MRAKLAGWVTLYAIALIFIALRIYSRIHIFGSLTVDDWLMVGAGIAYTGSMVTEVFIWKAFVDFTIVIYVKVFPQWSNSNVGRLCFVLHNCTGNVVNKVFRMVFYETTHAWKMDESGCERCLCRART